MVIDRQREIEDTLKLIMDRYGDRLSEEEKEELKQQLEANLDGARSIRAVALLNSDEPFTIFKPYRGKK